MGSKEFPADRTYQYLSQTTAVICTTSFPGFRPDFGLQYKTQPNTGNRLVHEWRFNTVCTGNFCTGTFCIDAQIHTVFRLLSMAFHVPSNRSGREPRSEVYTSYFTIFNVSPLRCSERHRFNIHCVYIAKLWLFTQQILRSNSHLNVFSPACLVSRGIPLFITIWRRHGVNAGTL